MELDALIRSICLRDRHHMYFLGAGASITSGIPSAWECIWNWKLSLFLTKNSHINPTLFGNSTLPHVQHRLQRWLDEQKIHPALNSEEEYFHYAEACFPYAQDRKDWFKGLVSNASPHVGYKLLGLLMETGKVKWIWTTNFDDLVERGRPANRKRPFLQIGMDSSNRFDNVRRDGEDVVQIFLHGDYRYDSLKNTSEELRSLDIKHTERFKELTKDLPLVVMGYSGRDKSIMDSLTKAYANKGNGGLFWCCMENETPSHDVLKLIDTAKKAENIAEIVTYKGFDDFIIQLTRYWLKDSVEYSLVKEILSTHTIRTGFNISHLSRDYNWIIGNAYPVELPSEIYQFTIDCLPKVGAWKRLSELVGDKPIRAGLFKGKILAMGKVTDIQDAFGKYLTTKIEQLSLPNGDLSVNNTIVYEIMLKGIVDSLEKRGLQRRGKAVLAVPSEKTHSYRASNYKYHESVAISLDSVDGKTYLITQPDIALLDENLSKDDVKAVKRDILWRQRNFEYMDAVKKWRSLLFPDKNAWRIVYPPTAETGFEFKVSEDGPVCARLYSTRPRSGDASLIGKFSRFEKFKAFTVEEPYLRFQFSDQKTSPAKSIHPIKGLIDCGGPIERYDKALHSSDNIRLGIVCLDGHENLLISFLNQLKQGAAAKGNFDEDYLVDFPGFEQIFRCGLIIPANKHDAHWKTLPVLKEEDPISMNQKAIQLIAEKIKELETSGGIDLVIIYIPNSWHNFEKISSANVHLDLHDQIKSICVERGIRSQLIRESKVQLGNNCRVRWWLSLALFTKSMRIPWLIDASPEKVAYVGIGYSVDQAVESNHVVLGCSHVFDTNGVGMRFRLSQLQNPIWRDDPFTHRKNPFMSYDDAYQLGNRTRQLFYEAHQSLPTRVMICKRTSFIKTEVEGILSSLSGIAHVDLLTIQHDSMWRFCAYDTYKKAVHGFPITRGTGMVMDDSSFLLWLHGNVLNPKNNRNYFQGKSRIPTPVRVTRYAGDTAIEIIAHDLLALTKMDWNTFALYKQLPVTITTPTSIARIGRLLHKLSAESYDYRLFM